jgi:hypothetical protein
LTISVRPAWPAVAVLGLSEVIVSAAMVKVALFEVTPPSSTVTVALPAVAIREAVTVAVNSELLTKAVVNSVPFHCTTAPAAKPEPLTVSVKSDPPAVAELGDNDPIAGSGAMVKVALFDVTPSSNTVTSAVPGEAIRLAATVALN